MTKKSKGKKKFEESKIPVDVPIPNLPEKFLWMHVNSGTKIRNVLNYALKEFSEYKSVLWSGAGQGIGKVITCAEICKKKNPGLHQITKLRYIKSKKSEMGNDDNENRNVPEIHIFLSKDSLDPKEPGHQSSIEDGLFLSRRSELSISESTSSEKDETNKEKHESIKRDKKNLQQSSSTSSKLSNIATEEFAAMGLRTGQKRSHKSNNHDHNQKTMEETSFGNKIRKKGKKNN